MNFEEHNKDSLNREILLFEELITSHNAGRPTKEFTEYSPKTQINKVSQLVNETPYEELVVTSRVILHKERKRNASEVVSIVHSDKEVAAKIEQNIASEVSKPIAYTPDEALGLYVDNGF